MQRALSDGLILRSLSQGHESDRANLRQLYKDVYATELGYWDEPDDDLWVDIILMGEHPTITDEEIFVVVDPANDNRVVSSVTLIPHVWRYETVELAVGQPELVATRAEYRHRGLVKALMDATHERSEALGHVLQGITGIEHYYRRFGYTMAVDLDRCATLPLSAVPTLKDDQQPEFTLRPATEADFDQLSAWEDYTAPQYTLSSVYASGFWRYFLRHPGGSLHMIVNREDEEVGYVALRRTTGSEWLNCVTYTVGDRSSYVATFDDVLRGIKQYAETAFDAGSQPLYLGFESGLLPGLATLIDRASMAKVWERRYAWYLRVPSAARLINTIKPVLEQRLVNSGAHRYTGELKINFFDLSGVRIRFEDGRIVEVEDIEILGAKEQFECQAGFPYHSFLNLVFGHRTYRALHHILSDCFASGHAEALLNVLFPVKPSHVLSV